MDRSNTPVMSASGLVKTSGEVSVVAGVDLAILDRDVSGVPGPVGPDETITLRPNGYWSVSWAGVHRFEHGSYAEDATIVAMLAIRQHAFPKHGHIVQGVVAPGQARRIPGTDNRQAIACRQVAPAYGSSRG
jgi:hypothetical protein